MNSKQRKTLESLAEDPIRSDIEWDDVVSLLKSLGVEVIPGRGSRVRFCYGGRAVFLDRPHPKKELKRYQVAAIRDFLIETNLVQE